MIHHRWLSHLFLSSHPELEEKQTKERQRRASVAAMASAIAQKESVRFGNGGVNVDQISSSKCLSINLPLHV